MKCPYCGAWNPKAAMSCSSCNAKFTYRYWIKQPIVWEAIIRARAVAVLIIVAVTWPLTIVIIELLIFGNTRWIIPGVAISSISAIIIFIFREPLKRFGWFGKYQKAPPLPYYHN